MAQLHGGQIVARALKAEGVSHVFTLCGGHVQSIYDGCLDEGIRVVDVRHEQSAGHAADAYARITGRPGVAIVTAGPGVTDVVTAVANAQRAQVPMVVIGGQGARTLGSFGGQDRGSLQDMNHCELMRPITKWSVSIPETRRLGEYMQSAFRIAASGVPGPVFLEMPLDILMSSADENDCIFYPNYRTTASSPGDEAFVDRAAEAIAAAARPMLIVGSQFRWTAEPEGLTAFLDAAPMPAYLNGMARGSLPKGHPSAGRHSRSKALAQTDCAVIFGTPLDFRLGYGEKIGAGAKLIQIDLDGGEIGRNRGIDIGIVGDAGRILGQLARRLAGRGLAWSNWLASMQAEDVKKHAALMSEAGLDTDPISPVRLCAEVNRFVDAKTIVVGDGGDFVATAAYTLDVEGRGSWMDPGPLGTLGVGPGYAMAAKLLKPDHKVILMLGDGSFGLNGFEFEAMVRQGIPVVGVIGNDACWTQIYRGQAMLYGEARTPATKLAFSHYEKVVEGLGGHGEWVERIVDLRPALERAFAAADAGTPALVNVKIGVSEFRKYALSV